MKISKFFHHVFSVVLRALQKANAFVIDVHVQVSARRLGVCPSSAVRSAVTMMLLGGVLFAGAAHAADLTDVFNRGGNTLNAFLKLVVYVFYAASLIIFGMGFLGLRKLAKKDRDTSVAEVVAELVCGPLLGGTVYMLDVFYVSATGSSISSSGSAAGYHSY